MGIQRIRPALKRYQTRRGRIKQAHLDASQEMVLLKTLVILSSAKNIAGLLRHGISPVTASRL